MSKTLLSIEDISPLPSLDPLCHSLNIIETRATSMRKALALLKKQQPDFILAEFEYGYGNNYAGVNISNLDVLLYGLQKYSPQTKVIVLVEKDQWQYVDKLNAIFPLHAVLTYPIDKKQLQQAFNT